MKKIWLKSALSIALGAVMSTTWAEQTKISSNEPTEKYAQANEKPVAATDDFYTHVNATWLKDTAIPADKSRWGAFDELNDNSIKQLHGIIDQLSTKQWETGRIEQKITGLYQSFMNEEALEQAGFKPLRPELSKIEQVNNKVELAPLFAHLLRIGVLTPINFGVSQDMKHSDQMIVEVAQGGLGLPDRDYYLKNDKKFVQTRAAYLKHIEIMLHMAGDKEAAQHAKEILKLETQLAKIQWSNVENRDPAKQYNIYKTSELNQLTPALNWKAYLTALEVNHKIRNLQVDQPSYFKGLSTIINQTPLPVWKAYLKWNVLSSYAPYLNKSFVDENFAFYGKTLRDVAEQEVRWKRGVKVVEGSLGEALGKLYVEQYFPAEKKQHMEQLVKNLIAAYDQSIDQLDWMSPATKVQARKKLTHLSVKIGYPNKWIDYSTLKINDRDLIANLMNAQEFSFQYQINKLGKPVDREEWGMTPQTVNAYYNPSMNEIVFPAAILQPPFFDDAADAATNYGGIGAVIGHEISHGFDDMGSQFDENGNMRDWWTAEDKKRFKEKTQALVQQYSRYEPIKGYHVNGELTLGENIADNSGLAIAYKAYKISLAGKPDTVVDGYTGDQRFYNNWARVWRNKVREAQAIVYLKTDPHSPGKVRANGTAVNQNPFYDAFGVKEGDPMYLAPKDRVHMW